MLLNLIELFTKLMKRSAPTNPIVVKVLQSSTPYPFRLSHLDRTKSTSLVVNMIVNRGIRALTMAHLFVSASPGFGFA